MTGTYTHSLTLSHTLTHLLLSSGLLQKMLHDDVADNMDIPGYAKIFLSRLWEYLKRGQPLPVHIIPSQTSPAAPPAVPVAPVPSTDTPSTPAGPTTPSSPEVFEVLELSKEDIEFREMV